MGKKFEALFDRWAETYDESVSGLDEQYREVFAGYDGILAAVAERSRGTVLEFGVGTGNLTKKLLQRGHRVYGIEPSRAMRRQAQQKVPQVSVLDGDFLTFPVIDEPIDTIVSTYAFHHVTDEEKKEAIETFSHMLASGGKVVFADTVFETEQVRRSIMDNVKRQGFLDLLHDLQTEYYTTIAVLEHLFVSSGFRVTFLRLNEFVWLMEAVKG